MKRISQRDIAKKLGVNVSTISRALRGLEGVGEDLRQKIMSLAEDHGYRPNPFAISLRFDTTHTIGIVMPDLSYNYYAQIVRRIEHDARKQGFMCIITDSGDTYAGEVECVEHLEKLHVDGIIICLSQETTDFSHLERLKKNGIPVVLFERTANANFSSVCINDHILTRQATLHLIDGGAKNIAFLGGPNTMSQSAERKHAYLEVLRERKIPIRKELVKCSPLSLNSGLADTLDLLDLPEPPDAILATHGMLALSSIQAILSRGLRVPEDIAIIGFVSEWVSDITKPRMTFVKQNMKEMGSKAFQLLFDQMNGDKSVQHVLVNARLELRESTKNINI